LSKSLATTAPIAALRGWMANRHVNALYVTRPVSIAYLTGFEANPHERLMALAIRPEGATLARPAL
jgi:Xaa-Pro dipeptidase